MPITNYQPSLAMTQIVALEGIYPSYGGGGSYGAQLGFIRTFAGNFAPGGTIAANGALLDIAENTALFTLYGTTYGGDGETTFGMPDLGGRVATHFGQGPGLTSRVLGEQWGTPDLDLAQPHLRPTSGGTSAPIDNSEPSEALNYVIQIYGVFPGGNGVSLDYMGEVFQFGGNYAPAGFMFCEGQLLPIAQYQALFALLGTTYGGDGETTFALPDLRGRAVIGTASGSGSQYVLGQTFGSEYIQLSQSQMPTNMGGSGLPFTNRQPSLALNYLIALNGVFPPRDGGSPDPDTPYLGEIVISATNVIPSGFARCEGQLLPISQNTALFSILGTTYGGDGKTTFALPDLRGTDVIGTNDDHPLGEESGLAFYSLTSADIAPLTCMGDANPNTFYGGDGGDILQGSGGNDILVGNGGHDLLNGATGDDSMTGGDGNDTYFVNSALDTVTEQANQGMDTVNSSLSYYALTNNVENLTLLNSSHINGSGNALANRVTGNDGNNHLYGLAGDDVLRGMGGNDILDGGADTDKLQGGAGNDTYIVDDTGTAINEAPTGTDDGGIDEVDASVTWTLGAYLENLVLTGASAINGTGNGLDNRLIGNGEKNVLKGLAGADYIDGWAGDDVMRGGSGDDTYVVDSTGDVVSEQTTPGVDDGGIDQVRSSVTFTLGAFVDNLVLTGSAAINGIGNDLNNRLVGNGAVNILRGLTGNDSLDGKGGADKMFGGGGNDVYYVDDSGDVCSEQMTVGVDDGGQDQVIATASYTIGSFIETLRLSGATSINATGNAQTNNLLGNTGNNVLRGMGGNDNLTGDSGADTFVFEHFGAANGIDHVTDFVSGVDRLSFRGSDYGFSAGHVLTEFSGNGAAAGVGGQFVYNPVTHELWWDANGSQAGGLTAIGFFDNGVAPVAGDFVFT